MVEPIGLAGLTIAVLDQSWKIGNGTAELISNYRGFDVDTGSLENKVWDENNRTVALRKLLMDPSSAYGGRTLFEQFDVTVQERIHSFLEEAADVLEQAHRLLYRRLGKSQDAGPVLNVSDRLKLPRLMSTVSNASGPGSAASSVISTGRQPSPWQKMRWSLQDKKRVEGIVSKFSDLNHRVHENIKLWCLGGSIGVDLRHLQHLEKDTNSRILGFDTDARLRMASSHSQEVNTSLEIQEAELLKFNWQFERFGERFALLRRTEKAYLLEYRSYAQDSPVSIDLDSRARTLVDKLANLLHQPKELVFRTPSCVNWFQRVQENKVAYMFGVPDESKPRPVSLLEVLQRPHSAAPSLNERFHLAARLAQCISQLQLVQWVHESFRSENILFFTHLTGGQSDEVPEQSLDYTEPWVFGFEFSRPEGYFSHGLADQCLARDVYRHPARQQEPTQVFSKIHDIYALGVVLLEIGLWQPALSLEKSAFQNFQHPQTIKRHLIKHAEKRLGSKMGTRYQSVVVKCLSGEFCVENDNRDDLKLQQAFRSEVVETLQRAAESV